MYVCMQVHIVIVFDAAADYDVGVYHHGSVLTNVHIYVLFFWWTMCMYVAYTLSSLSLHNARSSERQMMASTWLITTAAISFSYGMYVCMYVCMYIYLSTFLCMYVCMYVASPLDHMHPLRPLRSLFHPAIFLSTFGQAAIHIACMTLAVHWATEVSLLLHTILYYTYIHTYIHGQSTAYVIYIHTVRTYFHVFVFQAMGPEKLKEVTEFFKKVTY